MQTFKNILKIAVIVLVCIPVIATAQVFTQNQMVTAPFGGFIYAPSGSPTSRLVATTTPFFQNSTIGTATVTTLCLTADTCRTTWPSAGGSSFGQAFEINGGFLSPTTTIPIAITSTATSTFKGPISIASWILSTSTTVCISPQVCQFQVPQGSVTADLQIQQALNQGGQVVLGAGTFTVASTTYITKTGTLVTGVGGSTILKAGASLNAPIMETYAKLQNVTVENMKFDGNSGNNSSSIGFEGFDLRNSTITNNWFTNANNEGLFINGDASIGFYNVISNNDIDHNGIGSHYRFSEYQYTVNNAYSFNGTYSAESESDNDTYNGNSIDETSGIAALYLPFGVGQYRITNNTFTRFSGYGILMRSIPDSQVIGNTFDGIPSGFAAIQNGEFGTEAGSHNIFTANNTTGVTNSNTCGYSEVSATSNTVLSGNNFLNVTTPFCMNAGSTKTLTLDTTATSTFPGPVSLAGYSISTSTTVCPYPEYCQFQTDGTSDDVQIQAANDLLASEGGGQLNIKAGNYFGTAGTPINISSNIAVIGEGFATNIQRLATSTPLFKFNGVFNSSIQNLRLSDSANLYQYGINGDGMIRVQSSGNIKIDRNTINSNSFAIFVPNATSASTTNVSITNNTITTTGHQDAIGGGPSSTGLLTTQDIIVDHNEIFVNTPTGGTLNSNVDANCFDMVQTLRIEFTNNVCHGRVVLGSEKFPNTYTEVSGNILDKTDGDNYSGSIALTEPNATTGLQSGNIILSNNTLKNGTITVQGAAAAIINNVNIEDNTITTSPSGYQNDNTDGINLQYVTNSLVSGNTLVASTTGLNGFIATNSTNVDTSHNSYTGFSVGENGNSGSGIKAEFNSFSGVTTPYTGILGYIFMDTAGQIGINATSLGGPFEVNGMTNPSIRLDNAGTVKLQIGIPTGAGNFINGSAINDAIIRQEAGQKILFSSSASGITNDLTLSKGNAGFGTSTPWFLSQITTASSTGPQLGLSPSAGVTGWTLRAESDGGLDIASTTVTGSATSSVAALHIDKNGKLVANCFSSDGSTCIGAVTTVSNSDSTLTISPTSGAVVASLNLAHANGWTAQQTFTLAANDAIIVKSGASGSYADIGFGRTGVESRIIIPGSAGQFSNQSATGDTVFRSDAVSSKIIFQTGTNNGNLFVTGTGVSISTSSAPWVLDVATSTGSAFKPQLALTDSSAGTNLKHWTISSEGGNIYFATSTDLYATSTTAAMGILTTGVLQLNYANCNGTTNALGITSGQVLCDSLASDARLKKDFTTITDGLSIIKNLNPITFFWNDTTGNAAQHGATSPLIQYGFTAQDVQKVLPSAVATSPDGYFTLDKTAMIAPLVSAVQEEEKQIQSINVEAIKVSRSAEENWQWFAIGLLVLWNLYLTFRKR